MTTPLWWDLHPQYPSDLVAPEEAVLNHELEGDSPWVYEPRHAAPAVRQRLGSPARARVTLLCSGRPGASLFPTLQRGVVFRACTPGE